MVSTNNNTYWADKFSEDLYLLLMSSSLRPRVRALAEKYGISNVELRAEILRRGGRLAELVEAEEAGERPRPAPIRIP